MDQLGKKQLTLVLARPLDAIPAALVDWAGDRLQLSSDGLGLVYTFDARDDQSGIAVLLRRLGELGIDYKDLRTAQSSLEDIFVNLVKGQAS